MGDVFAFGQAIRAKIKSRSPDDPALVKEATRLARRHPGTGKRRSLRTIAGELVTWKRSARYFCRTHLAFEFADLNFSPLFSDLRLDPIENPN